MLGVYYVAVPRGPPLPVGRTLVFATLVLSNILLTLVNRSFTQSVWCTLRVPDRVLWLMLGLTLALLLVTLLVTLLVPAAQRLFGFAPVPLAPLGWCGLRWWARAGWRGTRPYADSAGAFAVSGRAAPRWGEPIALAARPNRQPAPVFSRFLNHTTYPHHRRDR